MPIKIGAIIQAQRVAQQLSQATLATRLNVTRQTVSKWELDKSYPDLDTLVHLSEQLHTDVQTLLGITPPKLPHHWFALFRWHAAEKEIPWYAGGKQRSEIAVALLTQMLAEIPVDQVELRAILADHYQQLMAQVTSVPYVLESLQIQVAGCLHRTHTKLSPTAEAQFKRLTYLSHIRGRIV